MARDILIVDDEADIRMLVSGILEDEGYEARTASTAREALKSVARRRPTLVVLDVWLQGSDMDGLEVLERIKADHPDLPVIVVSGHGNIETAVAAIRKGAYDYIEKPFKSDRLLLCVDRTIEAARLKRENDELRVRSDSDGELIGNSQSISNLRQVVKKIAPTSSRILVEGPPGSGKELLARLIHRQSARSNGPFVVLNCANMQPDRLEAQLFGSEGGEKGAPRIVGTLEAAHGGTLLLDEVGDMPMETQSKMLRVLQDHSFDRVGGEENVEIDVRIIASTSRDLPFEIAHGRFREDLYYRLNVVPLQIPPLRERREDVRELVEYFMDVCAKNANLAPCALNEDAIAALQAYEWPGNVREVKNLVERLLIMTRGEEGNEIRSEMLPPEVNGSSPAATGLDHGSEVMGLPLREAREAFERHYLLAQITRFGGNISRTAGFIGMERSALHRKLKILGVYNVEKRRGYDA
ncbi:MAG: sigma-54-dependent Fis family transcriptional regulator [Alphaproteobacteria bacterium]|nr:sigma-54-dependent Fis family transcriptional regulator [Alphaproteobacteria bacterium]